MRRIALVALAASLALAGCKPGNLTVSGTVTYRERITLPPDAMLQVTIEDLSASEGAARPVASSRVRSGGRQVPIPYTITLADPAVIDPRHQYGLRVRIETAGGELMFINDTRYGVITNGVMRQDVVVKRVAAP